MQQRTAVMGALCQAVNTHLPPCLEGLIDASIRALKEQRLAARSNFEAQGCEDFLRLCAALRERAISDTIEAILALLPAGITPQGVAPSNESEWQLVDDAEVEEMLEARRLVRQLREPLGVMEWRSCARLNTVTAAAAKDRESPLSLEFMVRALQARLHLREQLPVVRELFYAVAAKELGHVLNAYFKQLDTVFSEFQIEPWVDPAVHPALERQRARTVHKAPDAPYQAIQQLRAVGSSATPEAAAASDAVAAPPLDGAWLHQALAQVKSLSPPQEGWSAEAFLRELDGAGAVLSPRQRDDAGVVAELFQQIEQEQVIAEDIKPVLRRLMVPVAQAAMLEPAAFADATHPVRATLDKLIRLCDFSDPPNHALENRVEQLIEGIIQDYQGDSTVFSQCNEELEQLLAVQQRAYSNNADRVRQYNRGRDALEQAREQVGRELAALFGSQAPRVLLDWLDVGWRELLVHELIRYGQAGAEWLDDLAVIRRLNGWLQPQAQDGETGSVERAYESGPMLELLRKRIESFLPGQYRHTPVLKQLQQQLLGEQAVELVGMAERPAEQPSASLDPALQRWRERVQQLSEGDWLVTQRGQHLQLVWANAASDHYVLVDRQGREAGSFSANELTNQLATGWIGTSAPEGQGVIQDHLENIVGKLYRDIAHARSHDELTGLLNRRSFEAAVAQALASNEPCAFIYGHIDQFSVLNSSFGPLAGDTYLKQTASLLADQLPAGATLARVGGVDFAVILPQADVDQARQLAEQLRAAIEANPLEWQGHSHGVTLSLGIVLNSECHDVINLFRDLQIACNTAKEFGRNRTHIYTDEIDGARTGLMAIAGRVDDIVERGELSLRVQQIAPAAPGDKQLPHYEVLLVMQNELKLQDFISAAERYHRMTKVDRWVLKRVFTELAQHPNIWNQCSGVSINLSGSSLNDDKMLEFIEALFEDYPVPAQKICFELTETAAVANLTKTADLVRYLQRFGCTFSIDDFGTGFSSYEYLKRLPVDYVKIDGSFVKEIERSSSDLAMVKSINEIAHVLGRKTIAEYVETASIRERLAELGIDYVQGYGVQLPQPLDEFLAGC